MEVNIIGAGPSGLISSISAIRNGFSPIIYEEHDFCGKRENCSGLFSKTGLETLKEFIDYKKLIKNRFNGAVIDLADEKIIVEKKEDVAYLIPRSEFDNGLYLNAEKEGVKIKLNERIVDFNRFENIIGADGPNSNVAEFFNFPKIEKFISAAKSKIKYKANDQNKVYLYYSNEMFNGFFGWIIPQNEEECEIGCGTVLPNNIYGVFKNFEKKIGARCEKINYSIIPIKTRIKTGIKIKNRNIILVGDAAGQVKSTTGGGVILGGTCAKIAGIYANDPIKYEKEWRKKLGFEFKMHSFAQKFLEKRNWKELTGIARFIKRYKLDEYISYNGDMDKPSKMINFNLLAHFFKNLF